MNLKTNKLQTLIAIIVVLGILLLNFPITKVFASTLYESFESGGDDLIYFYGDRWQAQSFTPSVSHVITDVSLYLERAGSPGTITVSIKATSGSVPTGGDLCSGTTNGDTLTNDYPNCEWRNIVFSTTTTLSAGIEYAIVVRALTGDGSNFVYWQQNTSGGYAGGSQSGSLDAGANWTNQPGRDAYFREYGNALTAPTVTTQAVSSIGSVTATGNGNVTSDGGSTITERGTCWNTSGSPTTADSKATSPGTTGAYTTSMTSLTSGVLYYVKAYATNAIGTSYGSEVTFTTLAVPTVTTQAVSGIGATSATGNGNVTSDGGSTITERGVCWNASGNPTTASSKATTSGTTGAYTVSMGSLTTGVFYYAKAYAINAIGTSYGGQVTFTTLAVPTVTTQAVSIIGSSTAIGNGTVVSDGGSAITERGICWNTSTNPTTTNFKSTSVGTTGAYTAPLTGLSPSTLYHTKAYAINAIGTSYGGEEDFTTALAPGSASGLISSLPILILAIITGIILIFIFKEDLTIAAVILLSMIIIIIMSMFPSIQAAVSGILGK